MTHKSHERIAIFPGSFNPFTTGHMSILKRGRRIFDRVVVAVGYNIDKPDADIEARVEAIRNVVAGMEGVSVISYSGLTVEAASRLGARFILRGVRGVTDFEYERNLADVNRAIGDIETVVLYCEPELAMVSSSMVRELERYGYDASQFIAKP